MTRLVAKALATPSGKHNDRAAAVQKSSDGSFLFEPKLIYREAFLEDSIRKKRVW
jgi:hypothetical protein